VILRCTKKVLAIVGPPPEPPEPPADGEEWYANLLRLGRRQCLLLTHADTLFTIIEVGVTAAALRSTHRLITGLVQRELDNEALPTGAFGDLDKQDLRIAKTTDRSVLGCMNDMAVRCEYAVVDAGSLAATDLAELNRSLRRNINSARGYQQPIDLVARRLGNRHCGSAVCTWPHS
jgi:hypothetical protein